MNVASTIRAMRAAGIPDAQIIETFLALDDERLAANRARVAKCRKNKQERNDGNACNVTRITQKESTPTPPKEKYISPGISPLRGDNTTPKPVDPLASLLGHELGAAIVEHRAKIRKPMTFRAAKALAKQLAACPDPVSAAETMLANGWQGVRPEWLANRGPPLQGAFSRITEELLAEARAKDAAESANYLIEDRRSPEGDFGTDERADGEQRTGDESRDGADSFLSAGASPERP